MGFWNNLKQKRAEKLCEDSADKDACLIESQARKNSRKARTDFNRALEEDDKARFSGPIVADIEIEIKKTCEQIDVFGEEPHIHSQGFISPKQGINSLFGDIVDRNVYNPKDITIPAHIAIDEPSQRELRRRRREEAKKQRLEKAMLKNAMTFSKGIQKLSKKYSETNEDFFEELEEVLIRSDMGMELVLKISNNLQKKAKKLSIPELKEALVEELYSAYNLRREDDLALRYKPGRTNIFMVVGVNGTGKTTSLAKLANYFLEEHQAKVMIIAADTFRAGAVEQLEEWNRNRLNNAMTIVKGKPKQDPSSVIFDGLKKAKDENYDLVLIDTAGRLQNKVNLMNELKKMHEIVHRFDKTGPHEVLLTIDATTGQNGVSQAVEFKDITNVTGLVLTKMDGTSKGGIAMAIKDKLNIPVKMVGIGENVDDLIPFDPEEYLYGLVEGFMEPEQSEEESA